MGHHPETQAFQIHLPFYRTKHGSKLTLFTIWHKDPCTDRTDDSCGWFIRSRHVDQERLQKVRRDFRFEMRYWFPENRDGRQDFSTIGIVNMMFRQAAYAYFGSWKKVDKFMRHYLPEIISFAENPIDSLEGRITGRHGIKMNDETMDDLAGIVYTWIARAERPWYKHPKWHIRHWQIQIHWPHSFKKPAGCICDDNLRETV